MQIENEFRIPVPPEQAWPVLLDIERIAPCMPGATVTSVDGDSFTGIVKVKVGPITVTYRGNAKFVTKDESARRAVIEASGKETRGSGTAKATVTAQLHEEGGSSRVHVITDLAITGRPAQFGRGVMADVAAKLITIFADCLAGQLSAGETAAGASARETAGQSAGDETAGVGVDTPGAEAASGPNGSAAASAASAAAGAVATAAPPVNATRPRGNAASPAGSTGAAGSGTRPAAPGSAAQPRPTPDAIDLLGTAGTPVLRRVLPVVAGVVLLVLVIRWIRRRD